MAKALIDKYEAVIGVVLVFNQIHFHIVLQTYMSLIYSSEQGSIIKAV